MIKKIKKLSLVVSLVMFPIYNLNAADITTQKKNEIEALLKDYNVVKNEFADYRTINSKLELSDKQIEQILKQKTLFMHAIGFIFDNYEIGLRLSTLQLGTGYNTTAMSINSLLFSNGDAYIEVAKKQFGNIGASHVRANGVVWTHAFDFNMDNEDLYKLIAFFEISSDKKMKVKINADMYSYVVELSEGEKRQIKDIISFFKRAFEVK